MSQRGYTLIEILMVVLLVSIVSAVSIVKMIDFRNDAKLAVTRERLNSFREAILGNASTNQRGFLNHVGSVPASLTALTTRGTLPAYDPINKTGWNGPYVDANVANWDRDAWGTAYQYNAATRTITSCGPNLSCGNADDISVTF